MASNLPTKLEIDALFSNIAYTVGNEIRKEFERSGDYPKTGVQYPTLPNQSSSPYQSPATQSGTLHNSIEVNYVKHAKEIEIGSNTPYMKWLEEGTDNGKILPRKGLKQAIEKVDIIEIIDNKIKSVFR